MNADTWTRVKPIVAEASELPARERESYVAARCDDPELRRQILEILGSPAALSGVVTAGALRPGSSLGPYVVERLLGRGGMGEVYRARDSRLGRDVAIKVLPPVFALHPDRLERFTREAKLLASLNHPHICTLHDVGTDQGTNYLVMEYVEGESLADRVARGPLPVRDVLTYGMQIADALDKAHARGIVHRDLKPGNVMITKAGAKLLDFGLARLDVDSRGAAVPPPTETADRAIVGTWQYMAPEQVEGQKADARTDIWALGCLLYEMATGRRAFDGRTQASLIAAILEREPPPVPTVVVMPRSLDHVIRRCLTKSPDDRWQSAADVRHELKWIAEPIDASADPSASVPAARTRWVAWLGWGVAALAIASVAMVGIVGLRTPASEATVRVTIDVPDAAGTPYLMQLSPDGHWLAYVGYHNGSTTDSIWIRDMISGETRMLGGTEGQHQLPFWSPDARSLGFFAGGKLKRIDVATGVVEAICPAANARGGAWGGDGTIVFAPSSFSALFRVSAHGSAPTQLTTLAAGEQSHRLPAFAEDGRHFVFTVLAKDGRSSVRIGSLDRPGSAELVNLSAGFNSPAEPTQAYVSNHLLVYARGAAIFARPLDLNALRVTGDPVPLVTHVDTENFGRQPFSVSNQLVVYRRVSPDVRLLRWLLKDGSVGGEVWKPADFSTVEFAPEGNRLAVSVANEDLTISQVWIIDTQRGSALRLTDEAFADNVVWSADGSKVFYCVSKGLTNSDIYSRRADGSGAAELVVDAPAVQKRPIGWSADGRLLFTASVPAGGQEIRAADLGTHRSTVVRESVAGLFDGDLTADGRFLAYEVRSGNSGEVYVEPLVGGSRVQVSSQGGNRPRWRPDGKELYYVSEGKLVAAEIRYEHNTPVVVASRTLFPYPPGAADYVVGPGGQRFLILMRTEVARPAYPTVIVNWMSALKQP